MATATVRLWRPADCLTPTRQRRAPLSPSPTVRMRRLLLLLPVLALAACAEGGMNTTEATAEETRAVRLDRRELVLDGFAGDVRVTAVVGLDEAEVVFTKRAMGTTEAQAEGRLEQIRIEEAGDGEMYQFMWRTDLEGTGSVDAAVRVPLAANVVVRLGAGEIAANGLRGTLDAETGSGDVRVNHVRSPRLQLEDRLGRRDCWRRLHPCRGRLDHRCWLG